MFQSSSRSISSLVLLAVLSLTGCQKGGSLPNLVAVKGTVTLDGQPLSFGTVSFAPIDSEGQPATGKIVDGQFTMLTSVDSPGVVPGNYKVRIESVEPLGEMSPNPADVTAKPASLIPEKYNSIETSELEVEVTPGMAEVSFELES
jgi:hypothetical protein